MKHWYYKEECDADLSVCQHNPRLHTWCPSLCAWVLCSHRGYLRCNCVHAYLLHFSTPFWNVSVTARYERYWIASKYKTAQEARSRSFLYSDTGTVPKFFGLIIEKGYVQIHEINVVSHTQYIIEVHPSIVMHWKTVIIATAMLSKVVIPSFGPTQFPLQLKPLSHSLPRNIFLTPLNGPWSHGLGLSSIKPEKTDGQGLKYRIWVAKGLWKKGVRVVFNWQLLK